MYNKRIKLFIILSTLLLVVCLLRLAQMQLLTASSVQHDIAELKRQRGLSQQLKTIRGKILDRKGRVLAADEPRFWVHIDYRLSCFLDERVRQGKLLRAAEETEPDIAVSETAEEIRTKLDDLQQIINKCAQFKAVEPSEIRDEIQKINNFVWNRRMFQAWRRKFPNSEVFENYDSIISIPISEAIADFKKKQPDPVKLIQLVSRIDIAEMHESWPLLELKTDDDIFAAQLEFMETDGVQILPKAQRFYPYGTVAAQTIGWVGPATQKQDKELFANDRLLSYLDGETCGREDGVEYVCETILRGRRGEEVKDIDRQIISRTETLFGKDVSLTLDIELQQRIENYLTGYKHDPNCGPGMAVVVIDVGTGDILALVSLPLFDLNRARYDYDTLISDPDKPMINRTINEPYPPGSVVKPLILIAGLESGKITPEQTISCPAQDVPRPTCLQFTRFHSCHDWKWENSGGNKARNAIKGSCNIYFSHLADRIEPLNLQQWLFRFGYGQNVLFPPASIAGAVGTELTRNFRQLSGTVSSSITRGAILSLEAVPPLRESERRWFGIGQGNLRVTPLQVANAMAAIARGGLYKPPRLFLDSQETNNEHQESSSEPGISLETLTVIYDGMSAVVNENGGTAYTQFEAFLTVLAEQDVKVFGKTGSTEKPEHAWFAGFAQDSTAHKIAIAVVVEGGQHGSSDAAPLARDIIQFCIEAGYIGKSILIAE
ncbi:MAG: penicillin-binding transpeptidase domain-containing protein [Planctomycetota bacterium]|jgi:penicillin-binding protein 2